MYLQIIPFYQVGEAYLQQIGFQDDPQVQMTTTEVMTTALVATWFFANNQRLACQMMRESGLVLYMLSESRFNRRWHRITQAHWQAILRLLDQQSATHTYIVDSCPLAVCHNQRAKRCRLYPDTEGAYWGYCAAKEEYFYGLKAHTLVTQGGRPVEVLLLCGCSHDLTGLKEMDLKLPQGARVYADTAYTDYEYEEVLQTKKQIRLLPIRKSNAKRQHAPEVAKTLGRGRKRVETTFSQITAKLPHRLHAVRPAGFQKKALALFVAFAIWCAQNEKRQTPDG